MQSDCVCVHFKIVCLVIQNDNPDKLWKVWETSESVRKTHLSFMMKWAVTAKWIAVNLCDILAHVASCAIGKLPIFLFFLSFYLSLERYSHFLWMNSPDLKKGEKQSVDLTNCQNWRPKATRQSKRRKQVKLMEEESEAENRVNKKWHLLDGSSCWLLRIGELRNWARN